ncbi:MAG: ROK family protein [Opitutales bacterium]|jgi:predicted NBD/HSP70 family sugar kinase|nr:ROK family protein [Opitutales bacterium]MDP4777780.1 ROK family protein [Opitutales bacterium]MDP4883998.1 ROK family protein [Opitutales bacterium]MDP5079595.1 ROK family protein [Opitutales bacterium]
MIRKQRYDRSDIRWLNAVNVLQQLKLNGPMSRAQISASLGLTRATISNIVSVLLDLSIVNETELDLGGAGRPGLLLNLNPNCGSMIAVDVNLDYVSVVLSNVGQEVLWSVRLPLLPDMGPEESLLPVAELVEEALEISSLRDLPCQGICVALAGLVNRDIGELSYGPTSGWEHVPLKATWEARYKLPVHVENEAHSGAIGVHHFGPRPGVRNLIYLSLGVGLAAGVIVDGVLLRGKQGFAGQVGHTHFMDNGVRCGCGKLGCWVTEIGASAVKRKLISAGVTIPSKIGAGVDWIGLILEKAKSGDPAVLKVLSEVGAQLGAGAARLVETFNPSMIVIGGRMGQLMKIAEPQIKDAIFANTLPYMAEPLEVLVNAAGEDQIQGCLATVFDSIMKNPINLKSIAPA